MKFILLFDFLYLQQEHNNFNMAIPKFLNSALDPKILGQKVSMSWSSTGCFYTLIGTLDYDFTFLLLCVSYCDAFSFQLLRGIQQQQQQQQSPISLGIKWVEQKCV